MKKKAIFGLLLLILTILASWNVLAADSLNILENSVIVSGNGGIVAGLFDVENTGDTTLTITFTGGLLQGPGGALQVELPNNIQNFLPGEVDTVIFTANISNTSTGNYTGTITAIGGTAQDNVAVTIEVLSNGLGLSRVGAGTLLHTSDAGQTVSGSVTVKNERNAAIGATITGTLPFAQNFIAKTENIPAFAQQQISYSFTVPAGTASGVYNGNVDVSWNPTISIPMQVTVNPTKSIGLPTKVSVSIDMEANATTTFTITNTGNEDLNDLSISFTPIDFADDDGDALSLAFSQSDNIDIPVGGSKTITVTVGAPAKVDSGIIEGLLTISGDSISRTLTLSANVQGILIITDVEVHSDDSDRRIKPGQLFEVEVEVENRARDIDLEDVEITVFFLDGSDTLDDDDGDDLEEDVEIDDLAAGEDDERTFTFRMPFDVDDGDEFTVVVKVEAVNEDDSSQKFFAENREESIEVDKEDHEVEIFIARLEQGIVSCDRFTNLEVGLRDIGEDEEDVVLEISNMALGLRQTDSFELSDDEDDNNFEIIRRFPIDATRAREGTYVIQITALYNNRRDVVTASLPLVVQRCGMEEERVPREGEEEEEKEEAIEVRFTSGRDTFIPRVSTLFTARKLDGRESMWMVILLVLAILVVASVLGWGAKRVYEERRR
ncbi:hypothetical protein HYS48_00145 [Candidatus Woesearchaeota archaeon]|nr:hypothetical protein [Candidatus Woesearchaeota archaeon]